MNTIRQCIISITAAGLICGCISAIVSKKGVYGTIIKLLTSVFLVLTVISPWTNLKFPDYTDFWNEMSASGSALVLDGTEMAQEATIGLIKANAEAYILDKATALGLDVNVDISVNCTTTPIPDGVVITGAVSPYAKTQMQEYIIENLGIPKENQIWM